MKIKNLLILITLLIICFRVGDVSARDLSGIKPEVNVQAVLRSLETGEEVSLPVIARQYTIEGSDTSYTDYEVTIPALFYVKSASHYDSTLSIRVTLRQFYSEHVGGQRSVAVDRYEAKWEKFDNTVTIKDAYIMPAVNGFSEGGQSYYKKYKATIGTPNLNTWYITYPSWRGVYIIMNDFSYQAAAVYSKLVRGGSTWYLDFCVQQGGGNMGECD